MSTREKIIMQLRALDKRIKIEVLCWKVIKNGPVNL